MSGERKTAGLVHTEWYGTPNREKKYDLVNLEGQSRFHISVYSGARTESSVLKTATPASVIAFDLESVLCRLLGN